MEKKGIPEGKKEGHLLIREFAEYIGKTVSQIRGYQKSGIVPTRRYPHNGWCYFIKEDVTNLLDHIEAGFKAGF